MSREYELLTIRYLQKCHWLVGQAEEKRFREITLAWKQKNKDAPVERLFLFEDLVRCHLQMQRLVNRTTFFDGRPTDYANIKADRATDVSDEDNKRKQREWDKYFPVLVRQKIDLLKLALANSINLNLETDVTQLFTALDTTGRDKQSDNGKDKDSIARADRAIL